MEQRRDDQAVDAVRQWAQNAPWHRRILARWGLQGKLILAFLLVLCIALAGSWWLFTTRSRAAVADMQGEQAAQLSVSLAMAAKVPIGEGDRLTLHRMGRDLLKGRNIVFICFFNATGQPLVVACRDPDSEQSLGDLVSRDAQSLMQIQRGNSAALGDFVRVVAPVVDSGDRADGATRLLGYVAVGIAQNREEAQLRRISYLGLAMGAIIFLVTLPLAMGLVRRILLPIRQLVAATNRIAQGDYDTRVAVHRPDEIGTLARSFNEMVVRVKDQQEQLQAANHDLEEKVRQRTAELQSSNQRLSSEIAEKEDFLRAVSHDLNAPLRNIGGMATMLLMKYRSKFEEDVVHRLERIQKNVEAETDLIGELLELSRIKSRRHKFEVIDTGAMVRDIAGVFEDDLRSRGISLETGSDMPTLLCEKSRLRQVFQNLVDNAIKYMGDGPEKRIIVSCTARDDGVEFAVRDTGMGIEAEDLPRVFNVFRRGRNTAAQNVAGKGVGLASVKSIIQNYEGRIWVESEVGKGSTFRFTIHRRFVPALRRPGDELPSGDVAGTERVSDGAGMATIS